MIKLFMGKKNPPNEQCYFIQWQPFPYSQAKKGGNYILFWSNLHYSLLTYHAGYWLHPYPFHSRIHLSQAWWVELKIDKKGSVLLLLFYIHCYLYYIFTIDKTDFCLLWIFLQHSFYGYLQHATCKWYGFCPSLKTVSWPI